MALVFRIRFFCGGGHTDESGGLLSYYRGAVGAVVFRSRLGALDVDGMAVCGRGQGILSRRSPVH